MQYFFAVKIQFLWELAKITFVLISSSCDLIYPDLIPCISYLLMNLCSSNMANVYYTDFPLLSTMAAKLPSKETNSIQLLGTNISYSKRSSANSFLAVLGLAFPDVCPL